MAYRHPDTPRYAKLWLMLVLGYALSPLDLIPDFIPIIGYLDDLIIIPIGIYVALRLIPDHVMATCRESGEADTNMMRVGWIGSVIILLVWGLCIAVVLVLFNK